jgi:hypothetical protein
MTSPSFEERLCRNPHLSLRATQGSAAISMYSIPCEIASDVSLPRNDIVTQTQGWGGYKMLGGDDG